MAISCSGNMWGSWSCSPCGKYGGTQINTDDNMSLADAEKACNDAAMSVPSSNPYPTNKVKRKDKYKTKEKMGRHLRNATAIRVNNFNARRGSNSTCQQFNGGTMFESEQGVFSGFQGNSTNTDGRFSFASVPQGFSRASGVTSGGCPSGCAPCLIGGGCCEGGYGDGAKCSGAAKQVGGSGNCTPPNVYCKSGDYLGCHPQHKCNGGAARQVNKKSRRGSMDRISVNPIGGVSVAKQIGGCPKGCLPCHNGVGCCEEGAPTTPCAQGARRVKRKTQGGSPSSDFFLCPKGKCWGGKNCVPCTNGTPNAAFSGTDVYARNFGGGDVYARNFGGGSVYSRNFGGKNIF